MTLEDLRATISECSGYDGSSWDMKYTVKYDERTLIDLVDDGGVRNIFVHNDIIERIETEPHEMTDAQIIETEPHEMTDAQIIETEPPEMNDAQRIETEPHEMTDTQISKIERWLGLSRQEMAVSYISLGNDYEHVSHESVGQKIAHAGLFKEYLYKFSIAHNFKLKFLRNSKERMSVICKVEGCPWKICASALGKNVPYLRVTTFINEHVHSAQDNLQVRQCARSNMTSCIIIDEVRNHADKRASEIRTKLQTEYGLNVTYKQAYRAKEKAIEDIHGRPEHSYMLIPWICQRLKETDEKTVAEWVAGPNYRFERVFIAYGCCIEGFLAGARPVLYVDETHLSGPYKGTLLAGSAYDANNELLPFAMAIVKGETIDDWTWFMSMIKKIVGSKPLTIVSDRHNAIIGAVQSVFGSDRHAYCYRHVKENFSAEWLKLNRGKRSRTRSKEDALMLLNKIAWARVDDEFDKAMAEMREFSPELFDWLNNHGDVDKWAVSKFPYKRWDNITTNIAESFNAWMVKERKHNVAQMIHEHREKVAKKMQASSVAMTKWKSCIGPKIETKVKENVEVSKQFITTDYGRGNVNVQTSRGHHRVSLSLHHCSCAEWQMTGIPCRHACAAVKTVHGDIYDYIEGCCDAFAVMLFFLSAIMLL
ncbi:uncharacterized protein LOC114727670 [Neltuma alba]|uniref:uncharacterized protein LOC114727670 n=1 Tax=Neltuma alba TaxID=207710 RepID=UPI0010A42620|nr:uncharacterized protein LOC114727670 [Prosopis alba]